MKTDVVIRVDRLRLPLFLFLIATSLTALWQCFDSVACYGMDSSVRASSERKEEKNLEKAMKKLSPPWYSAKNGSIVFLPQDERYKAAPVDEKDNIPVDEVEKKSPVAFPKIMGVWFPVACLVVLLAVLGWFTTRALRERALRRRFREGELLRRQRRIETLAVEARARYDDLDSAAEEALARGDLRSALIFFFSWILVEMDKHEVVLLDKGKTNLEYWRELEGRPRLRDLYRDVMGKFERVYFGGFSISRPDFDKVWNLRQSFTEMMREEDERKRRLEQEREEALRRAAERNWRSPKTMSVLILALLALASVAGCSGPVWEDSYSSGGTTIPSHDRLNGFDVFYNYCQRQNRGRVRIINSLSEEFYDCNTIIWFCISDVYDLNEGGCWVLTSPEDLNKTSHSSRSGFNERGENNSEEEHDERVQKEIARAKAWRSMIEGYAAANEDDWTKFYIPQSNKQFHSPSSPPFLINSYTPFNNGNNASDYSDPNKSSKDRICEWLSEKPGRKCIVVLVDQNNVWDYWRAARNAVEQDYDEPQKSQYLEECDKRLDGMTDRPFFKGSPYHMTPQKFAELARANMKLRSDEASNIKKLFAALGDSSDDAVLVSKVLELRRGRLASKGRDSEEVDISEEVSEEIKALQRQDDAQDDAEDEFIFDDDEFDSNDPAEPRRALLKSFPYPQTVDYGVLMFDEDDYRRAGVDFGDSWEAGVTNDLPELWFRQYFIETSSLKEPSTEKFSGDLSWTSELPETAPLRERVKLIPSEGTETLLALGDFPLICRRKVGESEALLANTSTFLSNFGLTDQTNRLVARRLEREFAPEGDIGFYISETFYPFPRDVRDRSRRYRHKKPEGRFTLTQATPFTIFVWHVAVLAIVAGFCAWPIFGRARRVARDETSDFGMHVDATARLLRNSDSVSWVREQIDACRKFRKRDRPWGASPPPEVEDDQNPPKSD